MTHLTIYLKSGGHITVPFIDDDAASTFVKSWLDEMGRTNGLPQPATVYKSSSDTHKTLFAVKHDEIAAVAATLPPGKTETVYSAEQKRYMEAIEKLAKAAEKEAESGEEWRQE